jgi:exodeoxyribonuclease-3
MSEDLTVSCWNINSLPARIELCLEFIEKEKPDILLLQETKVEDYKFPTDFCEHLGYNISYFGQKSYNGVAIFSRYPVEEIIKGSEVFPDDSQARYLENLININGKIIRICNVYVPNGSEIGSDKFAYKLDFMQKLKNRLNIIKQYDEMQLIGGDFNVSIDDIDVYDPISSNNKICFHPSERSLMRQIIQNDFNDIFRVQNPSRQQFSWWDYRAGAWQNNNGLRIDYILTNHTLTDYVENIVYNQEYRSKNKPSDHAPLTVKIKL